MIVMMMGVSGSGKTTIGTLLAKALHCDYLEGDRLHPPENVAKMRRGVPLDDADRQPWLEAIHAALLEAHGENRGLVVGCSALKESYRDYLERGVPVRWVYLTGDPDLIRRRLTARQGHYMDPDLFESQLETLDEPTDALRVEVADTPAAIVAGIFRELTREPEVLVSTDARASSETAAGFIATFMRDIVSEKGVCTVALSGGETPRGLYRLLADSERHPIPWEGVQLFWCDERYVAADDPRSNYRMTREALLDHVPCPPANIHPMPTSYREPSDAAVAYEKVLREHISSVGAGFDLVLLGLGDDGHTASLFPGTVALGEEQDWVLPVIAPADPPVRLTLTLPLLTRSVCVGFLVSGSGKSAAVGRVVEGGGGADDPVGAIQRSDARVIWWLDRPAARALPL